MADPADIGPQYQCEECGVWSPAEVCDRCEAPAATAVTLKAQAVAVDGVNITGTPWPTVDCRPKRPKRKRKRVLTVSDCTLTINDTDLDELHRSAWDDYKRIESDMALAMQRAVFGAPKKDGNQ